MNKLMQGAAINPNYAGAEMAVEPTFEIDQALARINDLVCRVYGMSARMNDNADRVVGSAPKGPDEAKVGSGAPANYGSIHLLKAAIAALSEVLDSAEAAASRFDYL